MLKSLRTLFTALLAGLLLIAPMATAVAAPATPLRNAHAHNDYQHARPLLDALNRGYTSVEADLYPAFGQLYIGHYPWDVRPDRTLEKLYLDPLRERVATNGGKVFPGWDGEFQMLVEFKYNENDGFAWLDAALRDQRYAGLFTRVVNGTVHRGPITVVLTGLRPYDTIAAQANRYVQMDAGRGSIGSGAPSHLVPLISEDWTGMFSWRGSGAMSDAERARLRDHVTRAHADGRRVRFWASPETAGAREAVWREMLTAGVDHIGSDNLDALADFLTRQRGLAKVPDREE